MKVLYGFVVFTLLSFSGFAQTNVSGTITVDTEWTMSGSPYTLTSIVGIPSGVTLIINPGVQVNGSFDLLVKGKIAVNGSDTQPVEFRNTRLIFKSSDLSLSTLRNIKFNNAGLQLAEEHQNNQDNPKNSNSLIVTNSSFTNGGYARVSGYFATSKLRLEDCFFSGASIGGNSHSELIELVRATITNSNIFSTNDYYENATISNTDIVQGPYCIGMRISDSEITNSKFRYEAMPSQGPIELTRVGLFNTYINLPYSNVNIEGCNFIATSVPVPLLISMDIGQIKNSTLEGYASLNAVNIAGFNALSKPIVIENVTFKTFNTILEISNLNKGNVRANQTNFINGSYNVKNFGGKSVDAKNNYWGTDEEQVIKDKIIDYLDNLNYGIVTYTDFSTIPLVMNSLPVPEGIYKGVHKDGTFLHWKKNVNNGVVGFKVYKKTSSSYTLLADAGNNDSFILSEGFSADLVVTAYSALADGINDQAEGHESAFSDISLPFIALGEGNSVSACKAENYDINFTDHYDFDESSSLYLIASLTSDFIHSDTIQIISAGSMDNFLWSLPDTLTTDGIFYYRIASDDFGIFSQSGSVKVMAGPQVNFTIESNCTSGEYKVIPTGLGEGITANWSLDGATIIENTITSFVVTWTTPGERTLTLTASRNGCETTVAKSVLVTLENPSSEPAICSVEFDESSGNNKVTWDFPHPNLLEVKVYREGTKTDRYELIATVPAGIQSYVDNSSRASGRAYRYRLSAVNICGYESDLSEAVTSFHLQLAPGIDGSWNLSWQERTESGEIEIYRQEDLDWQKIEVLASIHTSFTDMSASQASCFYQARISGGGSCHISSNIVFNGITSTEENTVDFQAYPNPTINKITFYHSTPGQYEFINTEGVSILHGPVQAGENQVTVATLSQGIYLLKIWSNNKSSVTRVFKKDL